MNHIFVEPHPSARLESAPIIFYVLQYGNGKFVTNLRYKTEKEAVDVARKLGFTPWVARVRITNRRNPEHWRFAE